MCICMKRGRRLCLERDDQELCCDQGGTLWPRNPLFCGSWTERMAKEEPQQSLPNNPLVQWNESYVDSVRMTHARGLISLIWIRENVEDKIPIAIAMR